MSFLSIQLLNELSWPFRLTYSLSPFRFIAFCYLKYFLVCLLQFLFIKRSNSFFVVKVIHNIFPWNSVFDFCNHKNFFWPIGSVSFSKNVFVFRYSYMMTYFKFIIFITFLPKSIHVLFLTSVGFISILLWYVLLYLFIYYFI